MQGPKWGLRLVLGCFILLAGLSSLVVPPFETPDEIWHFAVIQQLASGGGLPHSAPQTEAMWRQQGAQAPGYYLAAAALTAWIDQGDFPALYERRNPHVTIGLPELLNRGYLLHYPADGWPWQGSLLALHLVRFFSVLLGAVTLWAGYQTLSLLVGPPIALLGTALFAFIPQFIFISGAASNDNAINALAALLLWRLVRLLRDAPESPFATPRPYLLVGLLLGLALLAKMSGLWLLLLTLLVLGWLAWRARRWHLFLQGSLLVLGVALALSGWWFWRNKLLYDDWLALNIWRSNILLREEPAGWRTLLFSEWESLEHSFWGLFGWFNVAYPTWLYRLLQGLELLIVGGLLLSLPRLRQRVAALAPWQRAGLALLGLWLLMLTISWWGFFQIAPAAQGRYFHPAAPMLALLMALGLRAWRRPGQPPALAWGVAGGLCLLSAITPWWLIRPAYTPSAPLAALPEGAIPLEIDFEGKLRLRGYQISPELLAPSTPFSLTLYWEALAPLERPYSVAVKGFGQAGQLIARDDSYPDAGRWPTTLWEPGQLIADRKKIWLSGQTLTPTLARITVDVYELESLRMLPASREGESIPLPYPLRALPVREAGAVPASEAAFRFRPVEPHHRLEGKILQLDFIWEVGQALPARYQAFLHLTPALDQPPLAQADFAPLGGDFPTAYWWPGDRLPDQASLTLPERAPPGRYLLLLGLYDLESGQKVSGEGAQAAWVVGELEWDGQQWRK